MGILQDWPGAVEKNSHMVVGSLEYDKEIDAALDRAHARIGDGVSDEERETILYLHSPRVMTDYVNNKLVVACPVCTMQTTLRATVDWPCAVARLEHSFQHLENVVDTLFAATEVERQPHGGGDPAEPASDDAPVEISAPSG